MIVSELIEQLRTLDPDIPVVKRDPGCGCCSDGHVYVEVFVADDLEVYVYSKGHARLPQAVVL